MNNERYNQIIDEVYEKWIDESWNKRIYPNINEKEQFINKIKTDVGFSEMWELKIEEKELSLEERSKIWNETHNPAGDIYTHSQYNENNLPTKLITVTYKDKTIESYD